MSSSPPLPARLRAWVARGYGGPEVLHCVERPMPTPRANELLIAVAATTVTSGDRRIRAFDLPRGMGLIGRLALGITGPRRPILGTELTGTIVVLGADVARYRIGDPVIGFTGFKMGAHATHVVMPATGLIAVRPAHLAIETAAAIGFGGTTAMDYLRRAALRPGERVLVIGAAGTVGSALVQLAVHGGAHVTAVVSPANAATVEALGARAVIDRTRQPLTDLTDRFDIVADAVGALTFTTARQLLNPGGRYLAIAGGLGDLVARSKHGMRVIAGPAAERPEDFATLVALAAAGRYTPLIDSVFSFADLPAAHARVDTGHKRGSVVVRVDPAL